MEVVQILKDTFEQELSKKKKEELDMKVHTNNYLSLFFILMYILKYHHCLDSIYIYLYFAYFILIA